MLAMVECTQGIFVWCELTESVKLNLKLALTFFRIFNLEYGLLLAS